MRSRVFGRTREARDTVSGVRGRLHGPARAATSSYIAPAYFDSAADVALDLFAMTAPPRRTPQGGRARAEQPFIRYLTWGPMVFLAGITCETHPTVHEQYNDILTRAGALFTETGCDWANVVHLVLPAQEQDPRRCSPATAARHGAARQSPRSNRSRAIRGRAS